MQELGGIGSAIALTLTMFVEAMGYGVVAPTLPFLARDTGAGEGRIGLLIGLYAAVGPLFAVPFSILANRWGRRALVLVGLAALTTASIGFIFAPTYPWLVAARLAQGIGAAAIWVGALTMAADLSPDKSMGRSLAWITGSWSLGMVAGPALGGIGHSVRTPFVLYAILSGAALVAGLTVLPETGSPGTRTSLRGIMRILTRPPVLVSAVATIALSFYYGAIEAFMPLIVSDMNVQRAGIAMLFVLAALPAIALPRLSGWAADHFGDRRVILLGLAYAAVLSAVTLPLMKVMPLWALFLMIGLVEVLVYVPAVALLNRGLTREDRAFATGSHNFAFSTGFFLGPTLAGALILIGGRPLMFAVLAAVNAAALAFIILFRRSDPAL